MGGAFDILRQLKALNDYVDNAPQPSDTAPRAPGAASAGSAKNFSRADHVHPIQTTVETASKLAASRTVSLTGAVTGSGSFDGSADLSIDVELSDLDAAKITSGTLSVARGGTGRTDGKAVALASSRTISLAGAVTGSASFDGSKAVSINTTLAGFDASKITSGTIDIERIPAAALERLVVVANVAALLALDSTDIQTGDTVQITAASSIDGVSYPANAMFRVTNGAVFTGAQTEQTVKNGLVVYTAGAAASVPWSGVTGKPSTFAPAAHEHSAADITSGTLATARGGTGRTDGKAAALATARTISLTGDVTGSVSFDGSKNVSISVKKKNAAAQFSAAGTRSGNIAASTNYTVPSYVVGSGHLKVYLDGVLCTGGTDADTCTYKEVGTSGAASTTIQFHQAVPAVMDLLVIV